MTAKVLYIEDNPLNLRLISKFVQHFGYRIIEASTGLAGIAILRTEKPDLILVDINLPDIDGLEVTRYVKKNPAYQHIPVIAVTANAMHGDREQCFEAGCDGYIAKPIMRQELKNALAHFLSPGKPSVTGESVLRH